MLSEIALMTLSLTSPLRLYYEATLYFIVYQQSLGVIMSDIRNIINVDNRFDCTYTVALFNQESANNLFPIIPDSVKVSPGEDASTGDMWTPWCDSQKDLDAGHYIRATFTKKGESDIVGYLFQSGAYVYQTDSSKEFSKKTIVAGDSSSGKGEYKLEIHHDGSGLPSLVLNKY